jgi:protocatechuate 3,4-dioxygenase beta subunit
MRKYKFAFFCLGLLFIFTYPLTAQQSKKVTCTGKVTDVQGHPIAGAKVAAYEMQFDGIAGNFMLHKAGEVTTAADGVFTFTSEAKPERSTFYNCKIVAVREDLSLGWTIWNMREDAELNIELGKPEKLEGIIVDEEGKPVKEAGVYANLMKSIKTETEEEKKDWLPGIEPMMCLGTHTDNQGKFGFTNLPEDTEVGLLIKADGIATIYATDSETNTTSPIRTGQSDIKLIVMKEGRIEGRITDPDTGKGIAGTKFAVVATSSGLFYYRFVHTTNDDGTFDIGGLQTGQYLLRNDGFPHTLVDVESGKTTNISVKADRLSRPRGISGIVRDQQGKPLPNAVVTTCPPITEDTVTDVNGVFTLKTRRSRGSDEGAIYLLVRHKERNLAASLQLYENANEHEIKLTPGVIFSGKVVDVNGKGIPDAQISLTFWISDSGYGTREPTEIDSDGSFEIRAIPNGYQYSVYASADGYGMQYVKAHTSEADGDRMELEPLILAVANLSVSGVVVDIDGKPVTGAQVNASGRGQSDRWNIPVDQQGRFRIEGVCSGPLRLWANVRGERNMYGSTESQGGATDIKIIVAERGSSSRPVSIQPPSLIGKPLPELKEFGIESLYDAKDKMMIVCLFDMEQRPSRNFILQLSKRAQVLKEKDIVIVAIQASKIERAPLDEWLKNQGLSFPVGIIETSEKETRLTWGVKSLPWLILTDAEHIVTAEGFSLSELNEKIKP